MLSNIGHTPPHIVDVDWRLDFYLKVCIGCSNAFSSDNGFEFFVVKGIMLGLG